MIGEISHGHIPASHVSRTYPGVSPPGAEAASGNRPRGFSIFSIFSNPVPPSGILTNLFVTSVVKWDPGRKDRAPFEAVHDSNANQKPSADGGDVY
jgi:hypothetical protein